MVRHRATRKVNTPGENNGILEAWIDGELVYSDHNVSYRNLGYDFIKIDRIWMNIYHGGTTLLIKTFTHLSTIS